MKRIFIYLFLVSFCSLVGQPVVVQNPSNVSTCIGNNIQFVVVGSGTITGYQWEVSTDNGITWTAITLPGVNPIYSGWSTDTLKISGVTSNNSGYRFRCNLIGGSTQITQTFTSPGAGNWTCPQGVTSVTIQCWGGGGSGGGSRWGIVEGAGGGGGGGAFAQSNSNVVAGTIYSLFVGAGGNGVNDGDGNSGGNSIFGNNLVLAAGGNGGTRGNSGDGSGGWGGQTTNSVGSIKYSGGKGCKADSYYNQKSGPGGGAAGSLQNGGDCYQAGMSSGTGGSNSGGNGAGPISRGSIWPNSSNGSSGVGFGGGGSGGYSLLYSSTASGGGGANGAVRLIYNAPQTTYSNHAILTVNPNPQVTISSTGPTTFCSGDSLTITSTGANSYQWSNNQLGDSISVIASGSFFTIGTDNNGCIDTSNAISVVVNPNPQVTITGSGPTTFCSGDSVTITSTGANSYQWSNNQSGNSISVNTSGNFYVIGTDVNGCIDTSNTILVVVNPNPQVSISNNSSTTFCQGSSVTLTSTGASTYQWSNNQSGDSISVNTSGSFYTIGTDANGCIDSSNTISVVVNPNPQVTITGSGPTTFCSGDSVTITSTGANSYQWSNNLLTDSILVMTSGSFYAIGTDNNGCTDTSIAIQVLVNPNPQVTISSSGPTTFCSGGTVTLIGSGVPFSYLWSNGQPVQFINVNTTGTYYVIGTDNNGCSDTSNAITVQVNPLPTVVSSNTGPYCEGDNLSLNSSGGVSYSWTGPNGFSSTNQSPQLNNLSISMGGQYQVSSTDINGCIGNSSTLVVVNPKPTLTTGNPQSVCQGQTISLTSTGGSTYQWSGVNGFTSTNQNPTIPNSDLTMSGQYQVVGFNSFGCSDTGFINVVVNPLPVITSSGGGVFCSGSNVSLSSTGGQTYTWSGPNGFMSTQQNPVLTNVTQSMSGNYVVTGTDMNGCSSSSTLTMNVVSGPVVTTQPQNQTVGVPGPATFSIVSSDPNALFQWQTDLGVGFQNLTNSGQYSGVNTNTLSVNNVGFNNNNQQFRCIISTTSCSDTSDVGILFVDDSMTLEGQSEETIKIYPNPTQTDFTIEVPVSLLGEQFVVLDNLGRVVLKDDIRSTNQQISIQHLSRGTYVIKVNRFNQILILN